jgi:hypothetical protein
MRSLYVWLQPADRSLQVLLPAFVEGAGIVPANLRVYGCGVNLSPINLSPFQVYDIPVPTSQLPQSAGIGSNTTVRSESIPPTRLLLLHFLCGRYRRMSLNVPCSSAPPPSPLPPFIV